MTTTGATRAAPWGAADRGRLVAGRYRLVRPVAQGPRGHLWRAQDEVLDLPVAVAVPAPPTAPAARRAAAAQARLHHPGVARVYDAGEVEAVPVVVRDWVVGVPLDEHLAGGPPPVPAALLLAAAVAEVLAAVHHHGLAHGALSPGTVVIGAGGPVLTDLGDDAQADDADRTAAAADARATGAVLHAAVTGTWPLPDERPCPGLPPARRSRRSGAVVPPSAVRPGVPADVDRVASVLLEGADPAALPRAAVALRRAAEQLASPRRRRPATGR